MSRQFWTALIIVGLQALGTTRGQACDSSLCRNGALCESRGEGYSCYCVDGYTGPTCEINFDDCLSSPCRNNASCIDGVATYTCACAAGFTGFECQEDVDECISNPCLRNGECIDVVNGYACTCVEPFRGDNCSLLPCDRVPCENGGSCSNDLSFNQSLIGFVCDCPLGFTGERCEIDILECDRGNETPCHGNGLCVDGINDYSCLCEPGWAGDFCQSPVDDCIGNECRNDANCTDLQLGYFCECQDGFDGALCERERNECEVYKPCENGAVCMDLFDDYMCECSTGWHGINCTEQVNECLRNPCLHGATCLDLVGDFSCRCAPFYTGDLCETLFNPCAPEYNPCQNGANCVVPPDGQYRCFCAKGYTGVHCEVNINECLSHPCENNGTCEDVTSGYVCHCMLGWSGSNCDQNVDDCTPQSCYNSAECLDLLNGFECNCTREYTGRLCDRMKDFCQENSCLNGGTCINILGGYECLCTQQYTGGQCQSLIDACRSDPCVNNGTCLNTNNGAVCSCQHPYTGRTCGEVIDFCESEPCLNGGTCYRLTGGYVCVCPQFLTGKQCTELVDYCKDEPCKNGAYCINDAARYRCSCLYGYTGINCVDMVDFCLERPCQNSGNCSNIPGGFQCDCVSGYNGDLCQKVIIDPTPTSTALLATPSFNDNSPVHNTISMFSTEMESMLPSFSAILTSTAAPLSFLSSVHYITSSEFSSPTDSLDSIISDFKPAFTESSSLHGATFRLFSSGENAISQSITFQSSLVSLTTLDSKHQLSNSKFASQIGTSDFSKFASALTSVSTIDKDMSDTVNDTSSSSTMLLRQSTNSKTNILSSHSLLKSSIDKIHSKSIPDTFSQLSSTDIKMYTPFISSFSSFSSTKTRVIMINTDRTVLSEVPPNTLSSSQTDSGEMSNTFVASSPISTSLTSSSSKYEEPRYKSSSLIVIPDSSSTMPFIFISSLSDIIGAITATLSGTHSKPSLVISMIVDGTSSSGVVKSTSMSNMLAASGLTSTTLINDIESSTKLSTVAPTVYSQTLQSDTFSYTTRFPMTLSDMEITSYIQSMTKLTTAVEFITPRTESQTGSFALTGTFGPRQTFEIPVASASAISSLVISTTFGSSKPLSDFFKSSETLFSYLSLVSVTNSQFMDSIVVTSSLMSSSVHITPTASPMHSQNVPIATSGNSQLITMAANSILPVDTSRLRFYSSSSSFSLGSSDLESSRTLIIPSSISLVKPQLTTSTHHTTDFELVSPPLFTKETSVAKHYSTSGTSTLIYPTLLNPSTSTKTQPVTKLFTPKSDIKSYTYSTSLSSNFKSPYSSSTLISTLISSSVGPPYSTIMLAKSLYLSTLAVHPSPFLLSSTTLPNTSPPMVLPMSSATTIPIAYMSTRTTLQKSIASSTSSTINQTVSSTPTQLLTSTLVTQETTLALLQTTALSSTTSLLTFTPVIAPTLMSRFLAPSFMISSIKLPSSTALANSALRVPSISTFSNMKSTRTLPSTLIIPSSTIKSTILPSTSTAMSYVGSTITSPRLLPSLSTATSTIVASTSTSLSYVGRTTILQSSSPPSTTTTPSSTTTTTKTTTTTTTTSSTTTVNQTTFTSTPTTTALSTASTTTTPRTSCGSLSCFNSGTCLEDRIGIYCDCAEGFIGSLCETETSVCDTFFCENRGYCSVAMTTFGVQIPTCNCPLPFTGTRCHTELLVYFPSFLGSSYLELPPPKFTTDQSNEINLSLKTTQAEGTVLFSTNHSQVYTQTSYIKLRLVNGRLVYEFSCDGYIYGAILGDLRVNTGDVYDITIRQVWPAAPGDWCTAAMAVNGQWLVSRPLLCLGSPQALGDIYLGGYARYSYTNDVISAVHVMDGFVGCIRSLQVNQREIDMVSMATRSANIENCNVPVCQHSPCRNGGTCHSSGQEWFCSCAYGFAGTFCERKLCHSDPCLHGGTCIILEAEQDQLCLCPYGRGGVLCETELAVTAPYYTGTHFGHTSYSAYSHPHFITDSFEAEFYMVLGDNSTGSNLIMYMGNTGPNDNWKDFMAVGMHRGHLVFRFDLGSGYGEVYSPKPLNLSIPHHLIKFGRTGNSGWLRVDNQRNVTGRSRGPLTALNTKSMLYVGGYPHDVRDGVVERARFEDGLQGCIYQLRFRAFDSAFIQPGSPPGHVEEGRNVGQCTAASCQANPCHNGGECVDLGASIYCNCTDGWKGPMCLDETTVCDVTNYCDEGSTCIPVLPASYKCLCPLGKRGKYCDGDFTVSDPVFAGDESYMSLEPVYIRRSIDVTIQLTSYKPDGLIFYVSQHLHSVAGDFFAISMSTGKVQLRFDVGSGVNVLTRDVGLENGTWYTIQAGRNSTHGYLSVNNQMTVAMTTGMMSYLDTATDFYIGGVPSLSDVSPGAFENEPSGLQGCIRELVVNGRNYELTGSGAINGRNVGDCDNTSCGYSTCKNGGTCTPGENEKYTCLCTEEFYGERCEHPAQCRNSTCIHGICREISATSHVCDCLIGWSGPSCDRDHVIGTSARLSGHGYIVLADRKYETRNTSHTRLTMTFTTRALHALLLWNGQTYTEDEDYLGIGLQDGHVKVVWNLGWYSSSDVITSLRYNDGNWHTLSVEIVARGLLLAIDGSTYTSTVSGDFRELDTHGIYYIGGFKHGNVKDSTLEYFTEALDGCVRDVRFYDEKNVIFDDAQDGINIRDCP